jgi:hypothetical protein
VFVDQHTSEQMTDTRFIIYNENTFCQAPCPPRGGRTGRSDQAPHHPAPDATAQTETLASSASPDGWGTPIVTGNRPGVKLYPPLTRAAALAILAAFGKSPRLCYAFPVWLWGGAG